MSFDNKIVCRGYVRVSTDMQVQEGISIDIQKKRLQMFCESKDWKLVEIYTDEGISGKDMERSGLKSLLTDISKDEILLVTDVSRFSRSTGDAITMIKWLQDKGVSFVAIVGDIDLSTPMGRCLFRMLVSFYELERETLSANVSTTMQMLSKEGKLRPRPPFGYKFVGKDCDYVEVPEQQEIINQIKMLYSNGVNLTKICEILNNNGLNKYLSINKKTVPAKPSRFNVKSVRLVLIDQGIIVDETINRKPLEQRIVSHHKKSNVMYTRFLDPETKKNLEEIQILTFKIQQILEQHT